LSTNSKCKLSEHCHDPGWGQFKHEAREAGGYVVWGSGGLLLEITFLSFELWVVGFRAARVYHHLFRVLGFVDSVGFELRGGRRRQCMMLDL
jgi:hypothetical protein